MLFFLHEGEILLNGLLLSSVPLHKVDGLAASIATQPEPEKRSRKDMPSSGPRIEKRLSLILSIAGRMIPGGQMIFLLTY